MELEQANFCETLSQREVSTIKDSTFLISIPQQQKKKGVLLGQESMTVKPSTQ